MNKRLIVLCAGFVIASIVVLSSTCPAAPGGQGSGKAESWTFAIYVSGDNNLEKYWDDASLPLLLKLPANKNLKIVAAIDRLSTEGTELVEISGDTCVSVASYPEMDFGSGDTFSWFLQLVGSSYPSDKLAVTAWDHGYAWRYISDDVTSGSRISMPELQASIESAGVYIDLLAFDACNMAALEVVYQVSLTGLVGIVVGSEESVPTTGYPYDLMLTPMALDTSRSPEQVATDMVEGFKVFYEPQTWASTVSLSAISVDAISASAGTFTSWVGAMHSGLPLYADCYKLGLMETYSAWATHYHVDVACIAETLLDDPSITDESLRMAAAAVVSAIDDSVISVWGGRSAVDARGVTLWWGCGGDWKTYSEAYLEVAFAVDTGWWDFLDDYELGR